MEHPTANSTIPSVKRKRATPAERRTRLRESLWPRSEKQIWHRKRNDGYITIPKLLSLVCALLKMHAKNDPTSTYLDLWCRSYDEGIIENIDADQAAFSSGYLGTRAKRTWTDHMYQLANLGFIRIKADGNKQIAHVLILNPLLVIDDLRKREKNKIDDDWWTAYVARANKIGAALPPDPTATSGD